MFLCHNDLKTYTIYFRVMFRQSAEAVYASPFKTRPGLKPLPWTIVVTTPLRWPWRPIGRRLQEKSSSLVGDFLRTSEQVVGFVYFYTLTSILTGTVRLWKIIVAQLQTIATSLNEPLLIIIQIPNHIQFGNVAMSRFRDVRRIRLAIRHCPFSAVPGVRPLHGEAERLGAYLHRRVELDKRKRRKKLQQVCIEIQYRHF